MADINSISEHILNCFAVAPETTGKMLKSTQLKPEEFPTRSHRFIYNEMIELFEQKSFFTESELTGNLKQRKIGKNQSAYKLCGGSKIISAIFKEIPHYDISPENIQNWVYQLRDENFKITIKENIQQIYSNFSDNQSPGEYLASSKERLDQLLQNYYDNVSFATKTLDDQIYDLNSNRSSSNGKNTRYSGLSTGFNILSKNLDGIHPEFYVLAGASSMGKTTFITQLAYQIAKKNPDTFVLFFSFDQTYLDIIAKFVSLESELKLEYIRNPQVLDISMENSRMESLKKINEIRERMLIIDQTSGIFSLRDVKNLVRKTIRDTDHQIVVVIDSLNYLNNMMVSQNIINNKEYYDDIISHELKMLCRTEGIPVIGTTRLMPSAELRRPHKKDLLHYSTYLYDAHVVMLLYCEYMNQFETPFLEWAWNTDDVMVPIVELNIIKNKMFEFRGRDFFRFFNSISKYRECAQLENDNFNDMIANLREHKEHEDEQMKRIRFSESQKEKNS